MKNAGTDEDSDRNVCMVDVLLEAHDPETGTGMSEDDMIYECNLFLLGGYDTSRLALTWLFYLLASNPDKQRHAQEEVDALFEESGGELTADCLTSLPYVTMCIKEAMRRYPPAAGELRQLKEDTVLDGYTVPKGTLVAPVRFGMHYDEQVWEKPNEFYPEHFTPEQESKRPPEAYCPFSTGPRRCLGEFFAMGEIKTVTAYLLRHFDFVVDADHPVVVEKLASFYREMVFGCF